MNMSDFCGKTEFSILQFTCQITKDVKDKIETKEFFYDTQINRYIEKQIELFLKNYNFNDALIQTYKYEIYNTIMFGLKDFMNKKVIKIIK